MEGNQGCHKSKSQKNQECEYYIDHEVPCLRWDLQVGHDIDRLNHYKYRLHGQAGNISKIVWIIALTDTGANPWTMMIESLNTLVTVVAVRCARRLVYFSIVSIFDLHVMCLDAKGIHIE